MRQPTGTDRSAGHSLTAPDLRALAAAGLHLAQGTCLAPPGSPASGLILIGELDDTAAATLALLSRGWGLVSDRPTPVRWNADGLAALPRADPLLVENRRAREAGLAGTPVRPGSTTVAVDAKRHHGSVAIRALALVQKRRNHEAVLEPLTAHQKLERAANLLLGGALDPERDLEPSNRFAEHRHIARLPMVAVRLEGWPDRDAVDALLAWWGGMAAAGSL